MSEKRPDEMRSEYDFRGGKRGKYSDAYAQGVRVEVDEYSVPSNAVENPILNSPFDDFSGVTPRVLEGRRQAGYHGTLRTEQMQGAAISREHVVNVLLDAFDPTPEEVEKEERRSPRKIPKCIKCKDLPRLPLSNQQREEMNAIFTSISDVLCSPCAVFLTRDDVAQLRLAHMHLCRAGKERYCERCASATIAYARYLITPPR